MTEARRPAPPAAAPQQAPQTQVRRPGGETVPVPVDADFVPRHGDVLVVAYPEIALPLRVQYGMVRVGGCSYSRTLRDGDDVNAEYSKINAWLSARIEADARHKIQKYTAELEAAGARRPG